MAKKLRRKTKPTQKNYLKGIRKHLLQHQHSLSAIASLVAILTFLGGGIFFIHDIYIKHFDSRDQEYSGIWTNPTEGCIDCVLKNDATRPIILELEVKNGNISGVLNANEGWKIE